MGEPSGYRLIEEIGAENGTAINGHRLVPGVSFAVKHGDHVQLGLVLDPVSFPVAGLPGPVLAQNADVKRRGMLRSRTVIGVPV